MQHEVTIFHNPRCSKSRAALQIVKKLGIEPIIIEYLKNPPTPEKIKLILDKLGVNPRDIMRTKEPVYLEKELNNQDLANEELIDAIAESHILLERPIILVGEKAAIGRPPELILEIL
jgi:arsenate reductase